MSDLVEALRYEGMLRVGEKEMIFGDFKSRADRIADDICYQAADRIERVERELAEARSARDARLYSLTCENAQLRASKDYWEKEANGLRAKAEEASNG